MFEQHPQRFAPGFFSDEELDLIRAARRSRGLARHVQQEHARLDRRNHQFCPVREQKPHNREQNH